MQWSIDELKEIFLSDKDKKLKKYLDLKALIQRFYHVLLKSLKAQLKDRDFQYLEIIC